MATLCKYKVLIVDDEPMTRDLISSILSSKGHTCVTASDGVEALDKAGMEVFDAVVTDIVMPNMDGITLTMELLKRNPSIPIMVITGFTERTEGFIIKNAKFKFSLAYKISLLAIHRYCLYERGSQYHFQTSTT